MSGFIYIALGWAVFGLVNEILVAFNSEKHSGVVMYFIERIFLFVIIFTYYFVIGYGLHMIISKLI